MSTLADSFWAQFGGDGGDPQSVARAAIERYGSGRAAGRALGVDEKTIRRWKNGETARSEHVNRIAREARQQNADRATGPVEVKFRYAKRDRAVKFGDGGRQKLRPGTTDRMKDAYVRGDREGMAKAFIDGVDDGWYRRQFRTAMEAEEEGIMGDGEDTSSPGSFVP